MSTQNQQVVGNTPAPTSDASALQLVLQLLLEERREALEAKKERQAALARREAQAKKDSEYEFQKIKSVQSICTHKKGGKPGPQRPKSANVDYALAHHTFIDGSQQIFCLICKMKWRNTDNAEFLIRRGKKVENHTGIGWREAHQMLSQSTNTPTTSEIMLAASKPVPSAVEEEQQ